MWYRKVIKPILFSLPPEQAHKLSMRWLNALTSIPGSHKLLRSYFGWKHHELGQTVGSVYFPNPVGLAAGFDKDGQYLKALTALGFGFIEIGTITPLPQPGNPKPRLFRLPDDEAMINRMGFNNQGAEVVAARLAAFQQWKQAQQLDVVIGANVGMNRNTSIEKAADDYIFCLRILLPVTDFVVVNVSSPNTEGLRNLQRTEALRELLQRLQEANHETGHPKPLWLKLAPDLDDAHLIEIAQLARTFHLAALVVTNTTVARPNLKASKPLLASIGSGGLSGRPLSERSMHILKLLKPYCNNQLALVASGGIYNADEAVRRLLHGAQLVEVYTGLVYQGPSLTKSIMKKWVAAMSNNWESSG